MQQKSRRNMLRKNATVGLKTIKDNKRLLIRTCLHLGTKQHTNINQRCSFCVHYPISSDLVWGWWGLICFAHVEGPRALYCAGGSLSTHGIYRLQFWFCLWCFYSLCAPIILQDLQNISDEAIHQIRNHPNIIHSEELSVQSCDQLQWFKIIPIKTQVLWSSKTKNKQTKKVTESFS